MLYNTKPYPVIQYIVIWPFDSAIHPLNIWDQRDSLATGSIPCKVIQVNLGFWIPHFTFQILDLFPVDFRFQKLLNSRPQGFLIPWAGFPSTHLPCHPSTFPGLLEPDYLTWSKLGNLTWPWIRNQCYLALWSCWSGYQSQWMYQSCQFQHWRKIMIMGLVN